MTVRPSCSRAIIPSSGISESAASLTLAIAIILSGSHKIHRSRPMNEDRTLELSSAELRGLIDAATDRILAYIKSLPHQPSGDSAGGAALARSLREPLPETGQPSGELLELLFERVIPKGRSEERRVG